MKKPKYRLFTILVCGVTYPWDINDNDRRTFQYGAYCCNGRLYHR